MDKGLLTQALAKIAKRIGNEEKVLEEGLEGHRRKLLCLYAKRSGAA